VRPAGATVVGLTAAILAPPGWLLPALDCSRPGSAHGGLTGPRLSGLLHDVLRALVTLLAATALAAAPGAPAPAPATAAQILDAVKAAHAKAVVVNVWATWCIPCREEMPDLLRLRRAYQDRGVALLLVSGDFGSAREQAAAFLTEQGVDFPTYIKTGDDTAFINAFDPQWSGTLPATFIYDGQGRRRRALLGKSSYAQFEAALLDVLNAPAGG
jgi:thiol-disulfide isomerase/thioredoxin